FNPTIPIAPGASLTLLFTADAVNGQGVYWVDLLTEFGVGVFSEKVYTWPTALISIKDVYDVIAVDEDGYVVLFDLEVWVQGEEGLIANWSIN
ncbi:MAG: hypothetical protein V3S68_02375, partial [Dehalococcoidia bacterium]